MDQREIFINVLINPDYTRAIARIVSAVARYPEARDAVVAALRWMRRGERFGAGADGSSRRRRWSTTSSFAASSPMRWKS